MLSPTAQREQQSEKDELKFEVPLEVLGKLWPPEYLVELFGPSGSLWIVFSKARLFCYC